MGENAAGCTNLMERVCVCGALPIRRDSTFECRRRRMFHLYPCIRLLAHLLRLVPKTQPRSIARPWA